MMPRIRSSWDRGHGVRVPEKGKLSESTEGALFASRATLRRFRVLIDYDLFNEAIIDPRGRNALLLGLISHAYVALYRYRDGGPPDHVELRPEPNWKDYYPGWAVASSADDEMGGYQVTYAEDSEDTLVTDTWVGGEIAIFGQDGDPVEVYPHLDPNGAAKRHVSDIVAMMVSGGVGADVYITEREYLYGARFSNSRSAALLCMEDALPLISLYLRTQDIYLSYRSPDGRATHGMDRGAFFWVGTRAILEASWRWFSAAANETDSTGDDSKIYLAQSVLQRFQRAIEARDDMHCALNQPQNNNTANSALSSMDVVLVLLMGAVDATARVVHDLLQLSGSSRQAAWQNQNWCDQVKAQCPALGALFDPGTDHANTLTILRLLRNSVHGEALQPLAVSSERGRKETLFGLPRADAAVLVEACDALGGRQKWGVEEKIPGRFHADPGVLVENLFERMIPLLNDVMNETPVELYGSFDLSKVAVGPPADGPMGAFSEYNLKSIRWQLGL